uniref:LOW QUALITY PROTEIN: aldehyde dehydrogenase, mitochondrial-like n=1 Tax=Petromyzon marinus TaxID=7757 RepID=A0AAJ7ULT2_PETMA|nr:LOW QUALITY PROTEIN: aldehyde dehydrogenase, mitochondrial-like [Petromyzon marinus]
MLRNLQKNLVTGLKWKKLSIQGPSLLQARSLGTHDPEPIRNPKVLYDKLFINNEWVDSVSGKTFPTVNPATGEILAHVSLAEAADVDKAVSAAQDAFRLGSSWRSMDPSQRGLILHRLGDLMESHKALLASLDTLDSGKTYSSALGDVDYAIRTYRYFAGWADKHHGQTIPMDGDLVTFTWHEPVGVCAQIIPWNFPIVMQAWKLAPALALGNVCVLKPAEETPLSALWVASLLVQAGLPPGALSVLPGMGEGAGAALARHPGVDKVAFTGSTEVGRLIQAAAAGAADGPIKRLTLELGGKSPVVVMDDADLDTAVAECHEAVFFNQGQVCSAGSRTYVHEKVYDEFVERSVAMANARRLGDPFHPDTQQGPQVNEAQFSRVSSFVRSALAEGAALACGGRRATRRGPLYARPTVLTGLPDGARACRDEAFGPVQSLFRFGRLDEALARADASPHGLAAGVFTAGLGAALRAAGALRAGTVWVNCYNADAPQTPFGGFRASGVGRELGELGLAAYAEAKTVTVRLPVAAALPVVVPPVVPVPVVPVPAAAKGGSFE